jgi:hypothetical protein
VIDLAPGAASGSNGRHSPVVPVVTLFAFDRGLR